MIYANADIGPGKGCFNITPSNTVNFPSPARLVYVGTTGNIRAVGPDGVAADFVGVPAGSYLHGAFIRINVAGTTASNLVGYR